MRASIAELSASVAQKLRRLIAFGGAVGEIVDVVEEILLVDLDPLSRLTA
jgi:hypothetical protein